MTTSPTTSFTRSPMTTRSPISARSPTTHKTSTTDQFPSNQVFTSLRCQRKFPKQYDPSSRDPVYNSTIAMYAAALGLEIPDDCVHNRTLTDGNGNTVQDLAIKYGHYSMLRDEFKYNEIGIQATPIVSDDMVI